MKIVSSAAVFSATFCLFAYFMPILPLAEGFSPSSPIRRTRLSPSHLFASFNEATNDATAPVTPGSNGASKQDSKLQKDSFENLRRLSDFASILCVIDCTVLPIVTVILPLLGILNLEAAQLEFLHQVGHKIALFFVLPVGSLTSVLNYVSHKKVWITFLGGLGLTMVGVANSHFHGLPFLGEAELLHKIQHGSLHRIINLLGCSFLLGSNYLSQKQGCAHHKHEKGCSHDHSHCNHNHEH
jgi:hypothetical protein